VNAPKDQRTRLVTNVVNQATSPGTAPILPLRVLDVVAEDSHPVVAADLKSATSAQRSVISHATAPSLVVDTVVVGSVVNKADTVAVVVGSVDVKDRPATPAVVMATCLVTAPKVKSATTVAK